MHFNVALVYKIADRLDMAPREIETARRLALVDLDVTNTNAIICAKEILPGTR